MNENEKRAFWGAIGRGLWSGAKTVGGAALSGAKGMIGLAPSAIGNKAVNRFAHTALPIAQTVHSISGNLTGPGGGPGLNNPFTGNPILKASSARATTGVGALDGLAKAAFAGHMSASDVADALAYGAFGASKFVNPHEHPALHTALDAGALGVLGATRSEEHTSELQSH